jgi:uncharacterized protein
LEEKVSATPAALKLIEQIVAEHGPILFHQSGGCCDGSSPMCYPQNEFIVGDADVLLGHVGGAPVYISGSQFEVWKHTDLIIDVVPGRGGMFSLDNGREVRFLTRSRICTSNRGDVRQCTARVDLSQATEVPASHFISRDGRGELGPRPTNDERRPPCRKP